MRRWLFVTALAATVAAAGWVGGEEGDGEAARIAGGEPASPTVRLADSAGPAAEDAGTYGVKLRQRAMPRESGDLFAGRPPEPLVEQRAPDPPRAPALPFNYVGRMVERGEVTALLETEGRIQAVKAAQTVEGLYRIDGIRDDMVSLTYLPLGVQQTLQLHAPTHSAQPADVASASAPAAGRQARRARIDAASLATQ